MNAQPAIAAPYVFISYASADRERVLPLVDALARAGVAVWIDREGIHGGANYGREIAEAIKDAAAFVLMASSLSLASRNVKQEIAVAWEYERAYLPLLLEAVTIPDDLKYWLTAAQWIEVLDKPEGEWLPPVLAALAPLGITRKAEEQAGMPLAGRERELALLREKIAAAKEGKSGLVLIGGEAGVGKTTLAEAALREAAGRGFILLEGHCFDLAETPPYGPWIDLFAHHIPTPSSPPLPVPFAQRGTVGAVSSQMALFVAVEDFFAALGARQPVVALLDDLHWSDPASLDLLRFLARSLASLPLLVLVTYRTDELTRKHPLYQLLPQLAREAGAERIDLGRLDDDAVRALVARRYGLPDVDTRRLSAYLQARAEGNALFVGELLRSLEEAGALRRAESGWTLDALEQTAMPPLLRQVIDGRLDRIGEEARRLLAIAAVIGHEVPLALWAAVAEVDEDAVLAAAEQGLEARLLVEGTGDEQVRFAHALIREALYEGIPGIRRRRVHRRAGETLAALPDPDADAVAYHFRAVGDPRAAAWLAKAGERARRAHAYPTAIARMQEALGLLDGPEHAALAGRLLLQLSYMLRFTDLRQSLAYAEEAIGRAMETNDAVMRAAARFSVGVRRCHLGDFVRGLADLRAAVEALETFSPEEWQASAIPETSFVSAVGARVGLAAGSTYAGWYSDALRLAGCNLDDGSAPIEPTINGWVTLWHAAMAMGRPDRAEEAAEHVLPLYRARHEHYTLAICLYALLDEVVMPYRADDLQRRRALMSEAEEELRQEAAQAGEAVPRLGGHYADYIAGAWADAESVASAAVGWTRHFPWYGRQWAVLAALARARGDAAGAWRQVRAGLPRGAATEPGSEYFITAITLLQMGAQLSLDAGDLPTAEEWLRAHRGFLAWSGAVLGQSEEEALWAEYHRQSGDGEGAYEHAERALAHATAPRQPLALLAAHRLLGALDADAGRYEEAAAHLTESLAIATACEAPYERALTLLALAELGAVTGETEEAVRLLTEVRAICAPLGATPALARTDALAARIGVT